MMKKAHIILLLLMLVSISLGALPTVLHGVPPGHVDTAFHIAIGIDVQEGSPKALMHQWWHLRNHIHYENAHIVDRYHTQFFYPPLIHVLLALTYLLFPIGIGTGILIALLYSLSVPAVYVLLKSFNSKEALVGASIVSVSTPLFISQQNGFWTFVIALNLALLCYASIRYQRPKLATALGVCAFLTHWTFIAAILTIAFVEWQYRNNGYAKTVLIATSSISAPFLIAILAVSSWPYIGTSYAQTHTDNILLLLVALGGAWHTIKKMPEIVVYAAITIIVMVAHALGLTIIFSDMLQYALPYFVAAFAALALAHTKRKNILSGIIAIGIILSVIASIGAAIEAKPSITAEELSALIDLREEVLNHNIVVWEVDIHPSWVVVASKDARILYPFSLEEEPDLATFYRAYTAYNITDSVSGERLYIRRSNDEITIST